VNFEKLENLIINIGSFGDNTQIKVLEKVKFKEWKELIIVGCIKDNTFLENINFEKLEKLNLCIYLQDVKFLEKETYKNLKVLQLGYTDISALENAKLKTCKY